MHQFRLFSAYLSIDKMVISRILPIRRLLNDEWIHRHVDKIAAGVQYKVIEASAL